MPDLGMNVKGQQGQHRMAAEGEFHEQQRRQLTGTVGAGIGPNVSVMTMSGNPAITHGVRSIPRPWLRLSAQSKSRQKNDCFKGIEDLREAGKEVDA